MATIVYKSTDSGAPTLSGTAGDLITLLDAILVGTSGIAYGSKASAGWTKSYSGTNKASYRNNSVTGSGCHVRIDDDAPGAGGAREAFARVYKTMSDIDTGTQPCPTVAQNANGQIIRKSSTLDSTARPWILVADDKTFTLTIGADVTSYSSTESGHSTLFHAGDYETANSGDTSNYLCAGRSAVNSTSPQHGILASSSTSWGDGVYSFYAVVSNVGVPTSYKANCAVFGHPNEIGRNTSATLSYPAPITGETYFIDAIIVANGTIIGRLRGIAMPLFGITSLATGSTISGASGRPAGSDLILMRANITSNQGGLYVETVNSWG